MLCYGLWWHLSPSMLFLFSCCLPSKSPLETAHPFMVSFIVKVTLCFTWRWWWLVCPTSVHSFTQRIFIQHLLHCQALLYWHEKPVSLLRPCLQYLTLLSISTSSMLYSFYSMFTKYCISPDRLSFWRVASLDIFIYTHILCKFWINQQTNQCQCCQKNEQMASTQFSIKY